MSFLQMAEDEYSPEIMQNLISLIIFCMKDGSLLGYAYYYTTKMAICQIINQNHMKYDFLEILHLLVLSRKNYHTYIQDPSACLFFYIYAKLYEEKRMNDLEILVTNILNYVRDSSNYSVKFVLKFFKYLRWVVNKYKHD